jgi:O-antigen ligase
VSVARRLPAGGPAPEPGVTIGPLGWAVIGSVAAVVQAAAASLDWKLGLAVAIALVASVAILMRPYLLLPLSIIVVSLEGQTFGGMAVTRLLAPAAALVVVAEILRGGARIRFSAPLACASLYLIWAVASGIWSIGPGGTRFLLQSLAIAIVFMLAFAALLETEQQLRQTLYVFAFASAVMGGLSVFAFGGMLDIPHMDLTQAGRSQGGIGDPDFFAGIQLVAVPLTLVLASDARNPRMRILLYAAVLVILASIFTSLSRGAYIGVVVLGLLFLASRPERLFRSREEKAAALLVVALGMIGFFSRPFLRDQVITRAQSIYAPQNREDETGSGRTNLWMAALKTAEENPMVGIGYGSFIFVSQDLLLNTPGVDPQVLQRRDEGNNFVAHNTYLGTLAELGVIGFALLFAIYISTGIALRRIATRAVAAGAPFVGRVAHALILGLIAWASISIFLSAETARMFWIIVGLTIALPKLIPEAPQRAPAADGYRGRSNAPTS